MNGLLKDLINIKDSFNLDNEVDITDLDYNLCLFHNTYKLNNIEPDIDSFLNDYLPYIIDVLKGKNIEREGISMIYCKRYFKEYVDDYFYRSIRDRMTNYLEELKN